MVQWPKYARSTECSEFADSYAQDNVDPSAKEGDAVMDEDVDSYEAFKRTKSKLAQEAYPILLNLQKELAGVKSRLIDPNDVYERAAQMLFAHDTWHRTKKARSYSLDEAFDSFLRTRVRD